VIPKPRTVATTTTPKPSFSSLERETPCRSLIGVSHSQGVSRRPVGNTERPLPARLVLRAFDRVSEQIPAAPSKWVAATGGRTPLKDVRPEGAGPGRFRRVRRA
jgi:hypothetical protein